MQISDPHIGDGYDDYGTSGYDDSAPSGDVGEAAQNLRTAVNWINNHKEEYKVKLIIVNGDLTDSAEKSEFYKAKEILDDLKVPYIPVFGNHDVWPYYTDTAGNTHEAKEPIGDQYFREIFGEQFDKLDDSLPNWSEGTRNKKTTANGYTAYLQNYAFDYAGHRLYCLDFNNRTASDLGPGSDAGGDIHDGTWDWFTSNLDNYPYKGADNVFIFAHHPLTKFNIEGYFTFTPAEYNTITNYLDNHILNVGLWAAGHLHYNRIYNIKTYWGSTICPGHETAAIKNDPVEGPRENGGTVIHKKFNSKIFKVYSDSDVEKAYERGHLSQSGDKDRFSVSDLPRATYTITIVGDSAEDFDLYVKWGSEPTTSDYDARGYEPYSREVCRVWGSGTLYVMIRSYRGSGYWKCNVIYGAGQELGSSYSTYLDGSGATSTGSSIATGRVWAYLSGPDSGDFDSYLKWHTRPTTSSYDARGYSGYSQEIIYTTDYGCTGNDAYGYYHKIYYTWRSYSGSGYVDWIVLQF